MRAWIEVSPSLRITSEGAAWLPHEDALVIADVHVGYAHAARRRGGFLPNVESAAILARRVLEAAERVGARRLIIAGDLRHSTRDVDAAEQAEVERLLALLAPLDVALVAGNHDRGSSGMSAMLQIGAFDIVHHPPITVPTRWTIAGHLHPSTTIRDETGAGARYPCALVGQRMVVLPAFTEWSGGTDARRLLAELPGEKWTVLAMSGGMVYDGVVQMGKE
jgi:putative SbcD/Mre11-related phosphoesterase